MHVYHKGLLPHNLPFTCWLTLLPKEFLCLSSTVTDRHI